uniref:Seryl-tRNA synthetase n=1 Tax=Plectus sambesii TaxID=2011161 RepID=A0A914VA03_9BILA
MRNVISSSWRFAQRRCGSSTAAARQDLSASSFLMVRFDPLMSAHPHVVEPNLNFRQMFLSLEALQKRLSARGYPASYSVSDLRDRYDKWWQTFVAFRRASARVEEKSEPRSEAQQKALQHEVGELRKELRKLNGVIVECLRLPNDLLRETPVDGVVSPPSPSAPSSTAHMDTLRSLGMVRTQRDPDRLYLLGKPVKMLYAVQELLENALTADTTSIRLSPPHMVRPAIVEGCGFDPNAFVDYADSDSQSAMRLVGHSLPAFGAVLCRHFLPVSNAFPVRVHSAGTTYCGDGLSKRQRLSLFDCPQVQTVNTVDLCRDDEEASVTYGDRTAQLAVLTDGLDLPVEQVLVPSRELANSEMGAISYRAFGAELARLSFIGTYVSQRLRIMFGETSPKTAGEYLYMNYCHVNVTAVVGAIVEQHWSKGDCSNMPPLLRTNQ